MQAMRIGRALMLTWPMHVLHLLRSHSMRLRSGVQHAALVAQQVRQQQGALLEREHRQLLAAEHALYESMAAQAASLSRSHVFEKDTSKLTMRERIAAKARKEDMLAHSIRTATIATTSAAGGGADGTEC